MNAYLTGPHGLLALSPPILMCLFGSAILLMDVVGRRVQSTRNSGLLVALSLIGNAFIGFALWQQWQALELNQPLAIPAFSKAIIIDPLSIFINGVVLMAGIILCLISPRFLTSAGEHRGEYYALAFFAQCGMYFMVSGADLVTIFVGLELTAISFYILVGFTRHDRRSNEAALKYLLLGGLSSAFVVYGFSLLYGLAGSTAIDDIAAAASHLPSDNPLLVLGTVTVAIGMLFKVSAAPFHSWTPDAYDGAPTPVAAYLSVASKAASFGVLIRLLWFMLPSARPIWEPIVMAAAVLSLSIGSIAALTQDRLKRLLAYSSIAHAGYILLGFVAGSAASLQGVYIYLFIYGVMNLGAFSVLILLRRHGISGDNMSDLRGLSESHPGYAALFTILLLSLAGVPPTAGFLAKYFIFVALIETGHYMLAVVASVYVTVSLYFYFRLVREMYLLPTSHTSSDAASFSPDFGVRLSLIAATVAVVLLGLLPEAFLHSGLITSSFTAGVSH